MKIYPVIHFKDEEQTLFNAAMAARLGCPGVFVIDMNGRNVDRALQTASDIQRLYPALDVGFNFLGYTPVNALRLSVNAGLRATWTDNCVTHTRVQPAGIHVYPVKDDLAKVPNHKFYGAVAFKYQPTESNPGLAATRMIELGGIPTTSGAATGVAVDIKLLQTIRDAIGESAPLALASGISASNAPAIKHLVSHGLVASSITDDVTELISEAKLIELLKACE